MYLPWISILKNWAWPKGSGQSRLTLRPVNPVEEIKRLTGGKGVDVSLELIGLPSTMRQALQSLTVFGRAVNRRNYR